MIFHGSPAESDFQQEAFLGCSVLDTLQNSRGITQGPQTDPRAALEPSHWGNHLPSLGIVLGRLEGFDTACTFVCSYLCYFYADDESDFQVQDLCKTWVTVVILEHGQEEEPSSRS